MVKNKRESYHHKIKNTGLISKVLIRLLAIVKSLHREKNGLNYSMDDLSASTMLPGLFLCLAAAEDKDGEGQI